MKTLNDLIKLINEIVLNECTTSFLIKADIDYRFYPNFEKGKSMLSFSYTMLTEKTKDKKVDFCNYIEDLDTDLIQFYYYSIKTQCLRGVKK